MKNKLISWSNAVSMLMVVLIVALVVSSRAKVLIIEGMMKIGMFRPPTSENIVSESGTTAIFTLKTSDGKSLNIDQQKGKVLFINFWATWCPPCIAEMPTINQMYLHFKGNPNIIILPVDVEDNFDKSVRFMKTNGYSLPVYAAIGPTPAQFLGSSIPETIIIDKTGKIVVRHEGGADYMDKQFLNYITALSKK